jgi:hypothetical protein
MIYSLYTGAWHYGRGPADYWYVECIWHEGMQGRKPAFKQLTLWQSRIGSPTKASVMSALPAHEVHTHVTAPPNHCHPRLSLDAGSLP